MSRHPSDEEFSEFVQVAWPGLVRTAYLLLGDRGLAEDLAQTALAKTYAAWPKVRDVQAAPGYARTTLVNTAASWFRRRSWRNELPTALPRRGATAVRMDEVVQQIYYTSAGLLVRTNKDGASDGGAPFHFVLVAPDGTTQKLGLTLGEVVPGVDPTQPLLAYADMAGDTEQVVVHDLTTDQDVARFDVPGQMTWGGWPAPPVALSGDLVFVGNDTPVAVNWRTGEVTTTDAMPEGMPVVNGGRTVLSVGKAAEVVDLASGETLLTVPDAAEGFQLLSPDGRYVRIGAWDKPDGFDVYGVDSGSVVSLRGQTYQYGWTADGRLFTVSGDSLKVCSPTTGDCSDQPLPDGLSFGKDEFLRYAGSIYES